MLTRNNLQDENRMKYVVMKAANRDYAAYNQMLLNTIAKLDAIIVWTPEWTRQKRWCRLENWIFWVWRSNFKKST